MADEQPTQPVATIATPGQYSGQTNAPTPAPEAPKVEDKSAAYEKRVKELEEQNKSLTTIADLVYYDEALRKQVQEKYAKLNGEGTQEPEAPVTPPVPGTPSIAETEEYKVLDQKVSSLDAQNRTATILEFEKSNGITDLADEEKKDVKQQIASKLTEWGYSVKDVPIEKLGPLMNDAYKVLFTDRIVKEKVAKEFQNQNGMFGSFSGSSIEKPEDIQITGGQGYWIKQFALDPTKVRETLSKHPVEDYR